MRMLLLLAILMLPAVQVPAGGTLEVVLRDADTRAPIPEALVRLTFFKTPTPYAVTELRTDANGRVVFQPLISGNYAVSAQPDGYPVPSREGPGHVFTVGGNSLRHQVELSRSRGARLRGRVLDPEGNPIADDADVRAFRRAYSDGGLRLSSIGASIGAAKTNASGEFQISGVLPGEYYIRAVLRPERRISSLDKFPRITYYPGTVDLGMATAVNVKAAEEIVSLDIRMPNRSGVKISGTVTQRSATSRVLPPPSPAPPPFFYVTQYLTPAAPNSLEEPLLLASRNVPRVNPDEFLFEIDGISRGAYYLDSQAELSPGKFAWTRTLLNVEDRNIEGLQILLKEAPEIKGRLLGPGDPAAGNWSDVRISVEPRDAVPNVLRFPWDIAPDSRTGEFTLSGPSEDIRFIPSVRGLPPDSYIADLRQGGRSVYNDGVVRSNPSAGSIEIVISTQGGTVQGVLRNSSTQVLPFSTVTLVPSGVQRSNLLLYRGVGTNAEGQFTIRGVAPGDYKLFAWQPNPLAGAEESSQFLSEYESRGTPVRVTAGSTTSAQVIQIPLRW
jgi:hypothetical protein